MSLLEQVEALQCAEVIVGQQGQGLHLTGFVTGKRVLVLDRAGSHWTLLFAAIAELAGNTAYLVEDANPPTLSGDWAFPVDVFSRALDDLR